MLKLKSILSVLLFLGLSSISFGDIPGIHPTYLHALSDLQAARNHLLHRGGSPALQNVDMQAVAAIDSTMRHVFDAAAADGKDLGSPQPVDAGANFTANVHRARQLLISARRDIAQREDNPAAVRLRDLALRDTDEALRLVAISLQIGN